MRAQPRLAERSDAAVVERQRREAGPGSVEEREQQGATVRQELGPPIDLTARRIRGGYDLGPSTCCGHAVQGTRGRKHDHVARPPRRSFDARRFANRRDRPTRDGQLAQPAVLPEPDPLTVGREERLPGVLRTGNQRRVEVLESAREEPRPSERVAANVDNARPVGRESERRPTGVEGLEPRLEGEGETHHRRGRGRGGGPQPPPGRGAAGEDGKCPRHHRSAGCAPPLLAHGRDLQHQG